MRARTQPSHDEVIVPAQGVELAGTLALPDRARGLVLFAHGSGSSRFSPRNRRVAAELQARGLGTLLFDLLTAEEEAIDAVDASLRFDVELLAGRLLAAASWAQNDSRTRRLPIGLFGASTGAAAAMIAAARRPEVVAAVVSRGGRPDMAGAELARVAAPTLLLVGGADEPVLALNRAAARRIAAPCQLSVIPGATHLFEEPGALEEVARQAGDFMAEHLGAARAPAPDPPDDDPERFADRAQAGRRLAAALSTRAWTDAVVLGLPRGGVPVAYEVAVALNAPLDVVVVRKLGVPFQPELGMGAVAEGPALYVNRELVDLCGVSPGELMAVIRREAVEVRRRVVRFRGGRPPPDVRGRCVILVDDGIATGGTTRAAIRAVRRRGAGRLVLAAPVAARNTIAMLRPLVDEVVCPSQPRALSAIGAWYDDFRQVPDDEVTRLLERARARTGDPGSPGSVPIDGLQRPWRLPPAAGR